MSLFKSPRGGSPDSPEPPKPPIGAILVSVMDLSKRYDLYCSTPSEDRLYEDVKIIGIRTFEPKKLEYGTSLIGGYLEIEAHNGARMMIPHLRMYMICEHGTQPDYKVLRIRKADGDG
jgi:hypothetical protein